MSGLPDTLSPNPIDIPAGVGPHIEEWFKSAGTKGQRLKFTERTEFIPYYNFTGYKPWGYISDSELDHYSSQIDQLIQAVRLDGGNVFFDIGTGLAFSAIQSAQQRGNNHVISFDNLHAPCYFLGDSKLKYGDLPDIIRQDSVVYYFGLDFFNWLNRLEKRNMSKKIEGKPLADRIQILAPSADYSGKSGSFMDRARSISSLVVMVPDYDNDFKFRLTEKDLVGRIHNGQVLRMRYSLNQLQKLIGTTASKGLIGMDSNETINVYLEGDKRVLENIQLTI
ncbi:MAG: hypothetical protein UV73_C0008G0055 [Candidatus Gottesmanbacteria bacterium GW2011_GWA2_43_14]|uniref:Uncharacterized protein n=1 Tax=Candidatus Gottesmanbacteria bacterium GW2011_GWA2_43_14 TaxID=1618443 RepID=A0A0G1DI73_9BACT|nr:MAG: hypothetical protein UV73_C0008G0055 [Candidatus Gottesmanbacteria bacterium GW2011_GWA2_43_14]